MVMLGMLNMLLLLVGFLPAIRRKSAQGERGTAGNAVMHRVAH